MSFEFNAPKFRDFSQPSPFPSERYFDEHTDTPKENAPPKSLVQPSPYIPLALRLKEFDKTPDRYKKHAEKKIFKFENKLTVPHSPFLRTKQMNRKPAVVVKEEKMKMFKAKPVDPRILSSAGDIGVPKVPKKELTIPRTPAITRVRPKQFNVDQKPQIIVQKKKAFKGEFRLPGDEIRRKQREQIEKEIQKKLELEKKSKQFKAKPLPDDSVDPLPVRKQLPPTQPRPFQFKTDSRPTLFKQVLKKKFEEKVDAFQFKARPFVEHQPFVPHPSEHKPTIPKNVVLHSEQRALERHHYDVELQEKAVLRENMLHEYEQDKRRQEAQEIRRLRKDREFKATPIRYYPSISVSNSQKCLTVPFSPVPGITKSKKSN